MSDGQETWLTFRGTAVKNPNGWRLTPIDEMSVEIDMKMDDVIVPGGGPRVLVRKGARASRINVPNWSPAIQSPVINSQPHCPNGEGRCLGGMEFCCNGDAVGHCNGLWDKC